MPVNLTGREKYLDTRFIIRMYVGAYVFVPVPTA